jgi:RNA ligase (TIGR02306 family)
MAYFGVSVEKIKTVKNHPNADRLDIATLDGIDFQFVIGRNTYKEGDEVLYFPIESILPLPLLQKLGLEGKLSGPEKNRIKTIRLRSEISQGIVGSLSLIDGLSDRTVEGITAFLGVTKYEPEPEFSRPGGYNGLGKLPGELSKYDIEGAERNYKVVEGLMEEEVIIREKVEGTNWSLYIDSDNKVWVNQRSFTIEEDYENTYWKTARDCGLIDFTKELKEKLNATNIAVWGELYGGGIQKNYYQLKTHKIALFDIKVNGKWLDADVKSDLIQPPIEMAPLIFRGKLKDFLGNKTVKEMSDGPSLINPKLAREGIVINPLKESYCPILKGRRILKQRGPLYLANEK